MEGKKNILVVDDSALMRRLISDIITADGRFQVADVAMNGLEAFDFVTRDTKKYDAILLDINMPKMNGIQFLEQLEKMKIKQRVIIVSTLAKEGAKETVRCLELGAFDFVTKPDSFVEARNESFRKMILKTLGAATGVDIGIPDTTKATGAKKELTKPSQVAARALYEITAAPVKRNQHNEATNRGAKKLVALACSTGGPKALQSVIPKLPANLDAAILLVQHMPAGFTKSLAERLNELSAIKVKEASDGDVLQKGTVYIAQGGSQMRLTKKMGDYVITETVEPARNGLKPCADIMYESLVGMDFDDITCVVLTGMGGDGTLGIKQLNEKNNIYVIAQNEATCTVYGMPKVVAEAGLVDEVVPLEAVAEAIIKNVGVH
ncbi:MAG: chemotaxis response regulator protein-glutamate methylesterase [Lachnospiraceae bacterium]|nr:chemotaxis response regulator protein-glutamate methylesterase [Lachnospiraceae bacterium]